MSAHIRRGQADLADLYPLLELKRGTISGVIDVGWRCTECSHEWGFEHLVDDPTGCCLGDDDDDDDPCPICQGDHDRISPEDCPEYRPGSR